MSFRSAFRLLALAALVLATGGPTVVAQSDWNLNYPQLERLSPGARSGQVRRAPASRPQAVRRGVEAVAAILPKVDPSAFVLVIGDSLAEQVGGGLDEAFAEVQSVAVTRRTRPSSGLVRSDYHDWAKDIGELLATPERVTTAVVMLGSNDRQALRDETGSHEPGSDPWKAAYRARIDALLRPFLARDISVIWVGAPPMRAQRQSADMMMINDLAREKVRQAGAIYVDLWEPLLDTDNRYSDFGPSLGGETARLRTSDGVHFTRLGARKAAHFVELEVRRLIERRGPSSLIALPGGPIELDPQLRPGGVERLIDEMVHPGLDPAIAPIPPIALRPLAGPVLALTAAERAPGAVLIATPPRLRRDADPAAEQARDALTGGRLIDWKPGRADDHRWFGR